MLWDPGQTVNGDMITPFFHIQIGKLGEGRRRFEPGIGFDAQLPGEETGGRV